MVKFYQVILAILFILAVISYYSGCTKLDNNAKTKKKSMVKDAFEKGKKEAIKEYDKRK